nr:MBL fold metallo-hydrolase [uncultured Oscillibacter sp.]
MDNWFTVEHVDADTHIISEYRHWEETHAYLLNGTERSLLIDTGLGICNICEEVQKWTDRPVAAVATHIHWDHIGGHRYFPCFYAHEAELNWLSGGFPLTLEQIREFVVERCDLPDGFHIDDYVFFQGTPARVLRDNDWIDLGGRRLQVLHTPGHSPGHSPGHMCFWEADRGYLFTGDLVYQGTLLAYYPSTDPEAYLASMERIAALPVKRVLPAHHSLEIRPSIIQEITAAFRQIKAEGKLFHGGGVFSYGDFAIWI